MDGDRQRHPNGDDRGAQGTQDEEMYLASLMAQRESLLRQLAVQQEEAARLTALREELASRVAAEEGESAGHSPEAATEQEVSGPSAVESKAEGEQCWQRRFAVVRGFTPRRSTELPPPSPAQQMPRLPPSQQMLPQMDLKAPPQHQK